MKGVSPLIATVLLIAFTVALATIIMGWMGTFTRETTTSVSNKTTEAVDCASASISIDDVYIQSGAANVIIRNTGFADNLRITSAILYNTTGNPTETATNLSSGTPNDFDKGEIVTLTFSNSTVTAVNYSTFSRVVVTTSCGGVSDTFDGTPKTA